MKRAKCETFLPQLIALDKSAFSKDENINLQKKRGITQRIITNAMKWLWIFFQAPLKTRALSLALEEAQELSNLFFPKVLNFLIKQQFSTLNIVMKSILTYLCKIIYPSSIYYFLIKSRATIIPKGNNSSIFMFYWNSLYSLLLLTWPPCFSQNSSVSQKYNVSQIFFKM